MTIALATKKQTRRSQDDMEALYRSIKGLRERDPSLTVTAACRRVGVCMGGFHRWVLRQRQIQAKIMAEYECLDFEASPQEIASLPKLEGRLVMMIGTIDQIRRALNDSHTLRGLT